MSEPTHSNLHGCWQVLKAELGGQSMPADAAAQVELEFAPTGYTVRFGGEATDEGIYTVNITRDCWEIVLTGKLGVNAGRTIPGILQLKGDRMRVCYALEGNTPPPSFSAPEGTLFYLASYRRKSGASSHAP
ncbi:MAG: TIGR03067 domain-containing protein [Cephaloticoccus sp.]|nr:TIGR03067 domain-containing protein [Cephaloticoccus sp.]